MANPSEETSRQVIAVLWKLLFITLGMLAVWIALAGDISVISFLSPCTKKGGLSESSQLEIGAIMVKYQSVILLTKNSRLLTFNLL